MCGSRPRPPRQESDGYNGRLAEQQRREQQEFIEQSKRQQQAMAAQLQRQMETISRMTLQRQRELEAERIAARIAAASRQTTTYATTTSQRTPAPGNALTTEPIKPVRKTMTTLRITPGATQAQAGAGLNLGV